MSSYYPAGSGGGGEPASQLHPRAQHQHHPTNDSTFTSIDLNELDASSSGPPPRNHMNKNTYSYAPSEQVSNMAGGPGAIELIPTNVNPQVSQRSDHPLPNVSFIQQHNHSVSHNVPGYSNNNPATSNGQHSTSGQLGQPVTVIQHNHPSTAPLASALPNPFLSGVHNHSQLPTPNTENMRRVRRWKVFPGRNRFFCNGRIIMAKQISVFYFTLTLLTCTCILFFIFDCPFLATKVSYAIPVVAAVLFIFVLCTLLRTSFSDPGIIPRATPEEAADVERQIVPNRTSSPQQYRPPPRTKEVIINNQTIKLKYCFTCKIFRPPRASHCSLCDNCVERFDHHCPWVGNCVGKRNYRFFYMFIVSLAFLCIYVFACIITHLILLSKDSTLTEAIKKSPVSMVEGIICFFSVWSILGLAGFHTYLILSNLTTNEDIKGSFSSKRTNSVKNPYSNGSAMSNCYGILCTTLSPSLIQPRSYVYCDEQVITQSRHSISDSGLSGSSGPPRLMPRPSLNPAGYPIQPQYPNISPGTGLGSGVHQSNDAYNGVNQNSADHSGSQGSRAPYTQYGQYQGQMEGDQSKAPGKGKNVHGHSHHGHSHGHHHASLPPCGDHLPSECDNYMPGTSTASCRSQPGFRKTDAHMRPDMYYPYDPQGAVHSQQAISHCHYGKKSMPPSAHPQASESSMYRQGEATSVPPHSTSMGTFKPPSSSRLYQQRGSFPSTEPTGRTGNRAIQHALARPKDYAYKN